MKDLNLKVMNLIIERQFLNMAYILQMSKAQTIRCCLDGSAQFQYFN
jgi:hypothetical protein